MQIEFILMNKRPNICTRYLEAQFCNGVHCDILLIA